MDKKKSTVTSETRENARDLYVDIRRQEIREPYRAQPFFGIHQTLTVRVVTVRRLWANNRTKDVPEMSHYALAQGSSGE